jgi:hypothetical protein
VPCPDALPTTAEEPRPVLFDNHVDAAISPAAAPGPIAPYPTSRA